MKEIFVKVKTKGYKNRYKVSNYGRVYSIKSKIFLKPFKQPQGRRYYIGLSKNNKLKSISLPNLVLIHFKRHPKIKEISALLDLNIKNNKINNLKWMSLGDWFRHLKTKKNKVKGVYKHINTSGTVKWRSTLQINGKVTTFGYFNTKEEAVNCTYQTFMTKFGYAPW